ncbi:cell division cycle-associated protein 3 [Antennarius striatus]|uniref:cell division cycle-associated protein 3 n=1 Tax=Antennarius striatus TaxID=241820 RepID=UPI0035AE6E26
MGSSKSKAAESSPTMTEPPIKNSRVHCVMDPRSPSAEINRTPIQVCGFVPKNVTDAKTECPVAFVDPRSPTVGIMRTPMRDIIRETVGSYARRLGSLFQNETEGKVPKKTASDGVNGFKGEEVASTNPLLTPLKHCTFDSMAEHANLLVTPVTPPLQSVNDSSPFVLLQHPQFEVELETEEMSLEEAEEARESPFDKRLSLSLLTCHEGATSSQIFADVHCDGTSSPTPSTEQDLPGYGYDHSYAIPTITVTTESPLATEEPTDADCSPAQVIHQKSKEAEETVSSLPSSPPLSDQQTVLILTEPQSCTSIHCPILEARRSPSTVVLKPQWLGKGFGATAQRARGVQGHSGKGSSSALAMKVAVKNIANENMGPSGKRIQTGTEGRSPLQVLKETNSPRIQRRQRKLKVSTPDRQRLGEMDQRMLSVSFDKENR